MKRICFVVVLLALLPATAFAQRSGVSVGYGFGLFNNSASIGELEGKQEYAFYQGAYFHEFSILRNLFLVAEPHLSYIREPERGIDVGLGVFFRYYLNNFFFSAGSGGAYSSINFEEQGTHYFFILQAGLGYQWKNFFIEDRFRHYSNGGLAVPNRSIHANIVSIGYLF